MEGSDLHIFLGQSIVTLARQLLSIKVIQKQRHCIRNLNIITATTNLTTTAHRCMGEARDKEVHQHLLDKAVPIG